MKSIVELLKLPLYIIGALAMSSGIVLFSPSSFLDKLYLLDYKDKYGSVLGIVFVVSVAILVVQLLIIICKKISNYILDKKLLNAQIRFLKNIDEPKKEILIKLLQSPTHTAMLPMRNAYVIELTNINAITPAGSNHPVDNLCNPRINYFLQPWVYKLINEDQELSKKFYHD